MSTTRLHRHLLCSTIISATVMASALPAAAQDDEETTSDTITVTGSRLTAANIESSSPVQTIEAEAFDILGTVDTVDLVNTLPQAFADQDTTFANGANGTSTLNLRGLGAIRTLVLANGKRLPPGSPTPGGYPSDLNLIPAQLIERVEIVTGGASAVYGSDAIAGVANFILKRDFEGFEVDALYGFNQSNNNDNDIGIRSQLEAAGIDPLTGSEIGNHTYDITGIFGTSLGDGRGNVTGYFRYLKNDGLNQSERDFSQCALGLFGNEQAFCIGSGQGPFPTTFVMTPEIPEGGELDDAVPLRDANGDIILNDDGDPLTAGSFALNNDSTLGAPGSSNTFNFNPFNPLRRAVERYNAGFNAWYDITDDVEAYLEVGFTKSTSPQIIAPSAAFGSAINQVNCDNPVLSDEQRLLICGTADIDGPYPRDLDGDGFAQAQVRRRFVEGGGRTDDRTLTNFRVVGGFKGTLAEHWEWDIFGQYAETGLQRLQFNQVVQQPLENTLDIVTDPSTGEPACRVAVEGTDTDCVPFVRAFDLSREYDPALQQYIDTPTLTQGDTSQAIIGGTIQSDLGNYGVVSPFATDGISFLAGFEYRREELFTQADATAEQGLLVGSGGGLPPSDGATELQEVFFETSIPVVQGMPFFEELGVSGAYRRSDYESENFRTGGTGGDFTANTFAAGVSWTPVDDIRFRAQFQRAIRAPNVLELFLPVNTGLSGLDDPCSGFLGTPEAPSRSEAECARTGVLPGQYGAIPPSNAQLNVRTGGNPDLVPEESDTITIGAVIQPRQIDGLTVSLDYFDIELDGAVGTVPATFTLQRCLDTGASEFCDLIQRGPNGSLTFRPRDQAFIDARTQNIGGLATSGLDAQVSYSHGVGKWGDVNWNYAATRLFSRDTTPVAGAGTTDCVGLYDLQCGIPTFEYRHVLTTVWRTPWDIDIATNWRYQSGVDRIDSIDTDTGAVVTWDEAGLGNFTGASLDAQHYLDVTGFWNVRDNVQLRLGVRNITDNDPPVVPQFGPAPSFIVEGNTVAGTYEGAGRFVFLGANLRF